jgi:hypothetical protein
MDRENRRGYAPVRNLLGNLMADTEREAGRQLNILDVVALLTDRPAEGLARGQVGTVVETLDDDTALVEFSDDQGRAYAVAPCPRLELLVLRYLPEAAA